MDNKFREKLTRTDEFVISVELVPTRGFIRKDFEELIAFTEQAVACGRIDALSLTDNPGGNPRLSPDVLGLDILFRGMSPLVHLTCKDLNRNGIESRAFQLGRMGVENLLALTGDYPTDGYRGIAKPSFDLDAVGMIRMLSDMNRGLQVELRPGKFQDLETTDFFIGAAVSPFKQLRSELAGQYLKLEKKIFNGAGFVITQLGYDARKFDELLRYMRLAGLGNIPVLGNVYVPHRIVSRIMNQNQVPGCVVSDELLEWVNRQAASPDKGKAAFLEFAARQVAVLRGLGCRGAHIGGFGLGFRDVLRVIELSDSLAPDWRSFVGELSFAQSGAHYWFQPDPETGLNTDQPARSDSRERAAMAPYRFMKLLHATAFEPGTPGFRLARELCRRLDGKGAAADIFQGFERMAKRLCNNCQECGDCSLDELAFLCPEAGCPKGQRNGPCGGSRDGICERQDRTCFWVRVLTRLERDGGLESVRSPEPVFRNTALDKTSSWSNYFLGKDHKRMGQEKQQQGK